MRPFARLAAVGCLTVGTLAGSAFAQTEPASFAASTLENQPLTDAITQLTNDLQRTPNDDATRFALGIAQTLHAGERLAGQLYKFGAHDKGLGSEIPFLRIPVPRNPDPQPVSAADIDASLAQFVTDLATADETLKAVDDASVKLPVRVGLIHVDLNGDAPGGIAPAWKIIHGLERMDPTVGFDPNVGVGGGGGASQPNDAQPEDDTTRAARTAAEQFTIGFDQGDAKWLRGYIHLLSAMAELVQAYDKKELVERTGHLFFDKVQSPYEPLVTGPKKVYGMSEELDIVDAIACVHLLHLPVRDAAHSRAARQHLLTVLQLSRESWAAIRAETDDDREWIPNDHQHNAVFTNATVTPQIIDGWLAFLDDAEACLKGEKLLPFWRGTDEHGVNLMKALDEPQTFDLILWIQGTGAAPFVETGKPIVTGDTIQRLDQLLEGNFMEFAIWVN